MAGEVADGTEGVEEERGGGGLVPRRRQEGREGRGRRWGIPTHPGISAES